MLHKRHPACRLFDAEVYFGHRRTQINSKENIQL